MMRACELCSTLVEEATGFRAAPGRPIDRKEFACAPCHAQWRALIERLIDTAMVAGSEFVLIAIAAGETMLSVRRVAAEVVTMVEQEYTQRAPVPHDVLDAWASDRTGGGAVVVAPIDDAQSTPRMRP